MDDKTKIAGTLPDDTHAPTGPLADAVCDPAADPVRGSLAESFFGDFDTPRMLGLCAEPGMGREELVNDIVGRATSMGVLVVHRRLGGCSAVVAARTIVRVVRELGGEAGPALLVLEEVPPADESGVERMARALRRALRLGACVVISVVPEAGQLLDGLGECVRVGARELLARRGLVSPDKADRPTTRGIYCLERSLALPDDPERPKGFQPSAYEDAVRMLVASTLRPSLAEEELRLRLALLLLGSGTPADLGDIPRGPVAEQLADLRDRTPLFGIGEGLDRFECLRTGERPLVETCYAQLAGAVTLFPEVGSHCAEVLAGRGEYARAATICKMLGAGDSVDMVLRDASRYLDAGECQLVGDALSSAELMGLGFDAEMSAARLGCGVLRQREARDESEGLPEAERILSASGREREALMLASARGVLQELDSRLPFVYEGWTPMARRLLVHQEVCELMACGYLSQAMRLLVANPCAGSEPSVSSALLYVDYEVLRLLVGDDATPRGTRLEEALALLGRPTLAGLAGYGDCLELLRETLCGDASALELADEVAARAERAGEAVVQSIALVARCLSCLRHGAGAGALAASELAVVRSKSAAAPYLARVAEVLGSVAKHLLGERGVMVGGERTHDDLDQVCVVVNAALASRPESLVRELEDLDADVPHNSIWLLAFLSDGIGSFSAELRDRTPGSWRVAVSRMRGAWYRPEEGRGDRRGVVPTVASGDDGARAGGSAWHGSCRVEVALLGRFEVRVDGRAVPDGKLDQRNAKSLLEYLALQRGVPTRRHKLVEQLWPSCDYGTGFNRVYQSTSVLRSAISGADPDLDPIVTSRPSKTVSLNMSVVCCDVDDFRACALEACDAEDSERALAMARLAESIYAGDLYVPPVDATGFVVGVRDELRTLYVDAMVAGAEAALRLGERSASVRFATNAVTSGELREDAVTALVLALKASGRTAEAERQYRGYVKRLAQRENRGPSKTLRSVMRDDTAR